jgi:four helix bundle protein
MNDDDSPTSHASTSHASTSHASTSHASTSHAPAHAHAHPHDHEGAAPFAHEKLDAYRLALKMAVLAKLVAESIPRGHRNVADHMVRSAANAVLLLAEGANRRTSAEKRQRFVECRGECGEVAAAADLVLLLELTRDSAPAEELKRHAARVSAMLTGLIARLIRECG